MDQLPMTARNTINKRMNKTISQHKQHSSINNMHCDSNSNYKMHPNLLLLLSSSIQTFIPLPQLVHDHMEDIREMEVFQQHKSEEVIVDKHQQEVLRRY